MKNLIIKWLGIPSLLDMVVKIKAEEALTQFKDEVVDFAIGDLNNKYDLDGLVSQFEDLKYLVEDKEYRWDDMADKVECIADVLKDKLDQVQEIDDRLTQLVAGYRLDVQLIKEEF